MAEHLISLKLKDGRSIDFHRMENNDIQVCLGDHCVIFPKASGQLTLDLLALLETFGEKEGSGETT